MFRQRVGVIELKAAPEDVVTPAYGRLLVASEHLFPGPAVKETVHPLTLLVNSPSKDREGESRRERERERERERGRWRAGAVAVTT